MTFKLKHTAKLALAISLAAGLGACTTTSRDAENNSSLNSVNQPVVERTNFVLDLSASTSGLAVTEQARLSDWFEMLDLGYGDRIFIDDPMASEAVEDDVASVAGRYGLLLADGSPVTVGYVDPGNVRIVVTRSTASVPDCPNWSRTQNGNMGNKTSPGYGCSINGNLAAMIADPEHLLEGAAGTGDTVIMSSTKAIEAYRDSTPSGAGGTSVSSESTQ